MLNQIIGVFKSRLFGLDSPTSVVAFLSVTSISLILSQGSLQVFLSFELFLSIQRG